MSMLHPGVEFAEPLALQAASEEETAIPVFVGYTEKGGAGTLVYIDTMAKYAELLGGAERASGTGSVLFYSVQHYFDNGGTSCFVYSVNNYDVLLGADSLTIAADLSEGALSTAIAQEPTITLLCVPDMQLFDLDLAIDNWLTVWQAMLEACRRKAGLFSLLDAPRSVENVRACLDYVYLQGGSRGAIYWPRLVSDYASADNPYISIPPSGAVAAAIQRTDRERGVWKAPANEALAHVVEPEISHLFADDLFQRDGVSINLIRSFPGRGVRIWGCRTLTRNPDSPWRYVQVRRLLSYIESRLSRVGRFSVFESNNEITWLKLKSRSRAWLRELWLSGGLFGAVESDAFDLSVGLDESMTAEDIKAGKLIMRIKVAALYPAEFIEIRLNFDVGENSVPAHSEGALT